MSKKNFSIKAVLSSDDQEKVHPEAKNTWKR
jgi:hypothetical protein